MTRAYRDYLEDMAQAAKETQEFTAGLSFAAFERDRKTVNAVLRSLEVLGEAAKKIPEAVRLRYADIPWREIAGMRDKLIHEYHGVDLTIIWKTIKTDIPPLIPQLEKMLSDEHNLRP